MRPTRLAVAAGLSALALLGCGAKPNNTTDGGQDAGPTCDALITTANLACTDADALAALTTVRAMSLDQKVLQMSGPTYNPNNMFDQADDPDLHIPGFKYMDGPRGVRWYNTDYGTTVFPVAAARASTWDPALERMIGKYMAREMRALGRHVLLAPTINQVTHPRWGRAQETYGEDSTLLGAMGSALIAGAQYDPSVADPLDPAQPIEDTYQVQACVKHLAANNIEDTRIYVNAVLDARTLREVYLPHFKKAVEAGASCVMTAYNRVNGAYNGANKPLVRDILKGEWGYRGFVISDWFAKGNTLASPAAGLDVEMPFSSGAFPSQFDSAYFYGTNLVTAINNAQVDVKLVDEAALRMVYAKRHHGVLAHPVGWAPYLTKSDAAQEVALTAAREGIVLLKNGPTAALTDDVLPLSKGLAKVAVVGKFANSENMGDKGSSDAKVMDSSLVITPFEGIRDALTGGAAAAATYQTVAGNEAALGSANVIVVVGAYFYADLARSSSGEEGEWKDRVSLGLPQRDLDNIAGALALKQAHPGMKVIVVIKSGGAVVVKDWIANVDALVMSWYAGMKEGQALAEILFGDVNPSGKTCQSFPVNESDLPAFNNSTTGDVTYSYYHGYRWLDRQHVAPQYPFGFGLSYTTFQYSNLQVTNPTLGEADTLTVKVDVTNSGAVAGSEVVQLYVSYPNTAVAGTWGRPVKELKAFARVADLAPGATRTATLTVKAADLAYWDASTSKMTVEKVGYGLAVAPSSDLGGPNVLTSTFTIQ